MADCGLSPFGSTTHLGTAFHSCFAAGIFTPLVTHVQQTQLNHIHLVLTSNPYMSSELGSPFLRMLCSPPSFEVYEPCGVANRSAHRTLSTVLALASTKQHAFVAHQEEHGPIPHRVAGHCRCASPIRGQFSHCTTPESRENTGVGRPFTLGIVRAMLSCIDSGPLQQSNICV